MAVKCHPPGTNRVSADISQPDRTSGTSFAGLFGRPAKHLKTMGSRLAGSLVDPLTRTSPISRPPPEGGSAIAKTLRVLVAAVWSLLDQTLHAWLELRSAVAFGAVRRIR